MATNCVLIRVHFLYDKSPLLTTRKTTAYKQEDKTILSPRLHPPSSSHWLVPLCDYIVYNHYKIMKEYFVTLEDGGSVRVRSLKGTSDRCRQTTKEFTIRKISRSQRIFFMVNKSGMFLTETRPDYSSLL